MPAILRPVLFALTSLAVLTAHALGQISAPRVVADINRQPAVTSSDPGEFTFAPSGSEFYFIASEPATGLELYSSQTVLGSARRRTDLVPGSGFSVPITTVWLGKKLFFTATTPQTGRELFVFDTAVAQPKAVLLKDIAPGPAGSSPASISVTTFQGLVFFSAFSPASGLELWKSDGTPAGTVMVRDIFTGSAGSRPSDFTDLNGTLYFSATDRLGGRELWKTDGTVAGTVRAVDIVPGTTSSHPARMLVYKNKLFFSARTSATGFELWESDGTPAGTRLRHDLSQGSRSSHPSPQVIYGGDLYFTALQPHSGTTLFRTDGVRLTRFAILTVGPLHVMGTAPNQRLAFVAPTSSTGQELLILNGIKTTVIDILPGVQGSFPRDLVRLPNGDLLFTASRPAGGRELYRSDGTTAGTRLVKDINTTSPTASSTPRGLTIGPGGLVVFSANDGVRGRELWISDGTTAGTRILADIHKGPSNDSSRPGSLIDANGTLYFRATDGKNGYELWRSDGTTAGTRMVADLLAGSFSSFPQELHVLGSKLLFVAATKQFGHDMVSLDLRSGAMTFLDVAPGVASAFGIRPETHIVNYKGKAYFRTRFGELWCTAGTRNSTRLVKRNATARSNSLVGFMTAYRGRLYFSAADGVSGIELWATDGTTAGTKRVLDISPGPLSSSPVHLTVVGDGLVFAATTAAAGRELYVTDGTARGTKVVDLRRGPASASPSPGRPSIQHFAVAGGFAYFTADNGTAGQELFRTDGTVAGTILVKDIAPGAAGSSPVRMTALDNQVLFSADDGTSGQELWLSNGRATGTVRVKDILPGASGSNPWGFTAIGKRRALFSAGGVDRNGAWAGREFYVTDGTSRGTVLAGGALPGPSGLSPYYFTSVGKTVFFVGGAKHKGAELFAIDLDGFSTRHGDGCSSTGNPPALDTTDPVLNRNFTLSIENAPPAKGGVALVGLRATSKAIASFAGGCDVSVDLAGPLLALPVGTNAAGRWSLTQRVPNDPRLLGLELAVQAGVGPTPSVPLGVDLTNMVLLIPGR